MPKLVKSRRRSHSMYSESIATAGLAGPTLRKVSDEDMTQADGPCEEPRETTSAVPVSPGCGSPRKRVKSLKRPVPSMCLVGLAGGAEGRDPKKPTVVSPQDSDPWGHFVDMVVPEDDVRGSVREPTNYVDSNHHPYPKTRAKRRTIRSKHSKPEGFVLTLPDVDEAADQLQCLSF